MSPCPNGHTWRGQPAWKILDTDFDDGETFFSAWYQWQTDAQRPRMLHYVALCDAPCSAQRLLRIAATRPHLAKLAHTLSERWFGLLPGFHRFLLDDGQVVLTLCVGERLALLRAQQFEADAVDLDWPRSESVEPAWFVKALTRVCRRGTVLFMRQMDAVDLPVWQMALKQSGFTLNPCTPKDHAGLASPQGQFDPPWVLKNTRRNIPTTATAPGRCAVIGAGLAGASVAAALARRGWQVQVLDQAAAPAAGASGLPVGLVVPHVSSDDGALSKLSRSGVRLMLEQARNLLERGLDWAPSGVLERQIGGTPHLPAAWPKAGEQWSVNARTLETGLRLGAGVWHHQGAWIKPASLVKVWLRQAGIQFQAQAKVADLQREQDGWKLLDDTGQVLCRADCVVFANASGAFDLPHKLKHTTPVLKGLERKLPHTQGMRGLLSWARHQLPQGDAFAPFPVNGSGSMISGIPMADGSAWFMGSSYQPEDQAERDDSANQAHNFDHLQQLLPELAEQLAPQFTSGQLECWKGTRCITQDRFPAVGPLTHEAQPSLWLCAGMGSRGLSFSVLCAELLAALLGGEPWPVETRLARLLEALRA